MSLPRALEGSVDSSGLHRGASDRISRCLRLPTSENGALRLARLLSAAPSRWSWDADTALGNGPGAQSKTAPFLAEPLLGAPVNPSALERRPGGSSRPHESEYTALGLTLQASSMPLGWTLHAGTGYYVHDELALALFAHPGHVRSVLGSVGGERTAAPAGGSDACELLSTLAPEDRGLRELVATLFSEPRVDGLRARVLEDTKSLKKLTLTLDTTQRLLLSGDRANAMRFREKVSALVPASIVQANMLFDAEKYAEALLHLKLAAVVYVTAGRRFRLALGQILDRISLCYFATGVFDESLRFAEHALYMFVTSGEEVEWALVNTVRNMGKCFRALELYDVAVIAFNFCLDSVSASGYVCVAAKQKAVVEKYDVCALLWVPDTDAVFPAETKMLTALCLMELGRVETALAITDSAYGEYVASGDEVRSIYGLLVMSIACYDVSAYRQSVTYAKTAYEYTEKIGNKRLQALALFYGAHSMAMCGLYREASLMFRLLATLPVLSTHERRGIPATLMFADCLIQTKQIDEAIRLLKDALRGSPGVPDRECFNLMLAECFVAKAALCDAKKHFALCQGAMPVVFEVIRERVKQDLQQLEHTLEHRALRASKELCPGFEAGGAPASAAPARRGGRRAAARAASRPAPSVRAALAECCVCLAAEATVAFSPCFHQCVCSACSAGIMAGTRECPMCRSASSAAHEILDGGALCASCCAAPPTCAAAPCFHVQFCEECARTRAAGARCATCAGAVTRAHRVFV